MAGAGVTSGVPTFWTWMTRDARQRTGDEVRLCIMYVYLSLPRQAKCSMEMTPPRDKSPSSRLGGGVVASKQCDLTCSHQLFLIFIVVDSRWLVAPDG